ncbi:hypothetical protein H4Q26_014559 [Puccinia striiformis f. sp. tritici PST-130]|nr:hypothetical protein H4Q26_014559 [Puccinia striiformis f. sp. tritici PST-130]
MAGLVYGSNSMTGVAYTSDTSKNHGLFAVEQVTPQTACKPVHIDPKAIPFCCSGTAHDEVQEVAQKAKTFDADKSTLAVVTKTSYLIGRNQKLYQNEEKDNHYRQQSEETIENQEKITSLMSRTASPSHTRRQTSNNYGNNNNNNNNSFRTRPGGGGEEAYHPQTGVSGGGGGFPNIRNLGILLGWTVKLKLNEGPPNTTTTTTGVNDRSVEESPGNSKGKHNYRMVKVNQIKDLQILSIHLNLTSNGLVSKILEPVNHIHVESIKMRQSLALENLDLQRARIGLGVSRWAQEIFDALGKTLPVRWHQTSIIILDEVLLPGPYYRSIDVKANQTNQASMSRVKQVLDGEWSRLLRTEEGKQMELEARNSVTPSSSSAPTASLRELKSSRSTSTGPEMKREFL